MHIWLIHIYWKNTQSNLQHSKYAKGTGSNPQKTNLTNVLLLTLLIKISHAIHSWVLQVVQRITEVDHRTRLLVVDRVTDEFLKFHGLPCTEERAIEMGSLSSRSSAASSPRASPRDCATPPYSRQSSESILINKVK